MEVGEIHNHILKYICSMLTVGEFSTQDQSLHQTVAEIRPEPESCDLAPYQPLGKMCCCHLLLFSWSTQPSINWAFPIKHGPANTLPNWEMKLTCRKICCNLSIQLLYQGVNTSIPPVSQRTKCSVNNIMKRCSRGEKTQSYSSIIKLKQNPNLR